MSERLLGALVGIHGDAKGLILPPAVAPIQVVIIPIIFKGKEQAVLQASHSLADTLRGCGLRCHIDDRETTPGNKYYDWELKGVPLRIEIGPRDLEKQAVMLVRRDTGEKRSVATASAAKVAVETLQAIANALKEKATALLNDNIHRVTTVDEATKLTGIICLPWCGTKECALEIENVLEGNTLGEPIDRAECTETCPVCGGPAGRWMRFARSY
jgi:prolyl-tRNA synthetase